MVELLAMKARYSDKNGSIETVIENDGKILSLVLRGVEFKGRDFDSLEPIDPTDISRLGSFTLNHGELCACKLTVEIPLAVSVGGQSVQGLLLADLDLGEPRSNGSLNHEMLMLVLIVQDRKYASSGRSGWFEDELLDIQRQLPEGAFLKACITCAFSDYSPGGHGLFGGLACFRDNKSGYKSVKSKSDLFRIWDTKSEFVQETYLCAEFERRVPRAGYRG